MTPSQSTRVQARRLSACWAAQGRQVAIDRWRSAMDRHAPVLCLCVLVLMLVRRVRGPGLILVLVPPAARALYAELSRPPILSSRGGGPRSAAVPRSGVERRGCECDEFARGPPAFPSPPLSNNHASRLVQHNAEADEDEDKEESETRTTSTKTTTLFVGTNSYECTSNDDCSVNYASFKSRCDRRSAPATTSLLARVAGCACRPTQPVGLSPSRLP